MNNEKKDWTENIAEETENLVDKAKGYGNQAKGKVKEFVSDITDDLGLRVDAEADKLKGKAQVKGAEVEDTFRDSTEDVKDVHDYVEEADEVIDRHHDDIDHRR